MKESKKTHEISNEENELKTIFITDENNVKHEGEIIFSFTENGDEYIIYELNNQAFGAKINEHKKLSPIDDDEWPLVEKIYNQFLEEKDDDANDEDL